MASEQQNWSEVTDSVQYRNSYPVRKAWAIGRRVWEPLVYSSAYLALIAVAKVFIVMYVLSLPLSGAPLVVGLVTFAVYANDRLVDIESDLRSKPRRTAFVRQHQDVLYVVAAIAYGIAVALSALGGPIPLVLTLMPGGAWVLYALDWVPTKDIPFQRLKEVLFVNSALVAGIWSLTVVFVPVFFTNSALTPAAWVTVLYFFVGTFINTEISNIGDVRSDRRAGVATIATVFGVRRTRHTLYTLTLLLAGLLAGAAVKGYLAPGVAATLAIGPGCLVWTVFLLGRVERNRLLTIGAECTRVPVFVAFSLLALLP